MKKSKFKKRMSMFMAILMGFSILVGVGATTAFATGTESEVYLVAYPRNGDENYSADWGHRDLHMMNGWSSGESTQTLVRTIGSPDWNICYCIEPGVSLDIGDKLTDWDEHFWDNYPSSFNKTIAPYDIKTFIGRILQYGYTGAISENWLSQAEGGDMLAHATATQILIWETVVGERDEDFNHVSTGSYDAVLDMISATHPLRSKILSYYNSIASSVQTHSKLPSFLSRSSGKAQTFELAWDGAQYTATLTDSNNVLRNYEFTSDFAGLKFNVEGNKLIVTSPTAPSGTISITASKNNSMRKGVITWSDGVYGPDGSLQDLITYAQAVSDPVKGYVNLKVSYGGAKIVKTSEDGKVQGITFRIQGNGIDKTVTTTTGAGGEVQIDNLKPGVYTVTELATDLYEPLESREVTVAAGQTATVTFNNTLKRGDLSVKKTSEDNFVEGVKFHLYGTSLSGIAVDEYAVTNASGVVTFEDVLIGSGYTLEEVDTAIRYVAPDNQSAAVEWNKVTQKSFDNRLKKWNATVTKSDAETGTAQGDASLAGAVYGVYDGEDLIDTYTTDASGSFTTKYYVCGDDWSIREITPSEGYLLDETSHPVGAEAKLYTAEYNSTELAVNEQVIKGNIAIIKHTDDGKTQIETPETGASFEVFLKSAGSYEAAKETERDTLTCDENGFAQTKEMPYGVYTVHQTSGWDGRELMADFDVFISEEGGVYRYLINNSAFEALIRIVKKDGETGKIIPAAGIGFKVRSRDTGEYVTQHLNYPAPVDLDTFYTDESGMLMLPEPLPYGNYEIIEVQAAYGYVLDGTPVPFLVDGTQATVTVEKLNFPQKGTITVTKTGEVFASVAESGGVYQPVYEARGLPGEVYEITAVEDIYTLDGTLRYSAGEVVDTITTDETGSAQTKPLYLGEYEVREITAPYGMTLNPDSVSVELTYAGQEIEITETTTSFYNDRQRVQLALSKVMEKDETFGIGENGEILSAQFGLFAAEDLTAADGTAIPADGLIEIVNCDENGSAMFRTDLPVGAKLYIKELATDSHYILSNAQYPVVFEYAGQEVATVSISVNNGNPIENDLLYGTVQGLKIDRETEATIAGAVFGLFRGDETEFTEDTAILIAESGEDGGFIFENVPFGNWQIVELKPAEGFLPNGDPYPVQVDGDGQIIEITAVNDRVPEIGTTATVGGEKDLGATEVFTLEDVVVYKHLIPGKEYALEGVLMDKATSEPLRVNGEEIRSEVTFIPEAASGSVVVTFTFDSKYIKADTDTVVFESLYKDGLALAVHADIEDEGQTVTLHVPEIGTQATAEGKKEAEAKGKITIEDVVSYKNLTPGKEYTVSGILMNKATGKPFTVDGKEIRSEATFTPEAAEGEVRVQFIFDAKGLTTATEVVVFESLRREGVQIALHADIGDKGQTVKLTPPVPDAPKTGDESSPGFWIGLCAIALGGMAPLVIVYFKKKRDGRDGNE